MYQDPCWALYKAAVSEADRYKLRDRIAAAEKAIAERLSLDQQLAAAERIELQESQDTLQSLKYEHQQLAGAG